MLPEQPVVAGGLSKGNIHSWISRGGWAILDQGLFATANFTLNVLLARLLLPSEYGVFAVAYAVFLLAGTVHTAIITEPMLVFGPGRFADRFQQYLSALVRWHWIVSGTLASVFVAVGLGFLWVGSSRAMAWTFIAMGCATAPILLQWLFRRSCYVRLQPRYSVEAGTIYFVAIVAGLFIFNELGILGAGTAFALLAVASLAASSWVYVRLTGSSRNSRETQLDIRQAAMAHRDYGRWAVGTAVVSWVPGNIYYLLLPLVTSVDDVAGLRALMNLIMPVLHVIGALGLLLLPALVREIRSGSGVGPIVRRITALFVLAGAAYGLVLGVAGDWLLTILYAGKYNAFSGLLIPLSILPAASALIAVFGSVIRAYERPDLVFRVYLGTLFITLSLGLALVLRFGPEGAAVGLLLSSATTAALMGFLIWKHGSGAAGFQPDTGLKEAELG